MPVSTTHGHTANTLHKSTEKPCIPHLSEDLQEGAIEHYGNMQHHSVYSVVVFDPFEHRDTIDLQDALNKNAETNILTITARQFQA